MLLVENITKKFPGVLALDNVCLELEGGKVTALIGENGAGKSTLMKILSGVYHDYEGQIVFKKNVTRFANPKEAQEKGVAIIHQELNLIPYLSVAENIFLGRELRNRWGMLDKKRMQQKTAALLQKLCLQVHPDTPVAALKVGQQQLVEIAKALLVDADVIIMDEPTSAISDSEVEVLFCIINELKREGKAIVYISHKLDELFQIADNYVVLRDGKTIESGTMQSMTQEALIQKMVGREIEILRQGAVNETKASVLRVQNLSLQHEERLREPVLKNVSFDLGRGEILGIFGLMGAGRTELLESLFGMHPKRVSGEVWVEDKQCRCQNESNAIKAGLALVPEDRKKNGLVLGLDVKSNISLTTLGQMQRAGILDSAKESQLSKKYIEELGIKTPSQAQLAVNLSGGNQQKIVLAKWLATKPKVLLLDEPTRGIDIKAKKEIYKLITRLAGEGLGILMVSSELPEILAVSDRVLVLSEGAVTGMFSIEEATEDAILKAAIPTSI